MERYRFAKNSEWLVFLKSCSDRPKMLGSALGHTFLQALASHRGGAQSAADACRLARVHFHSRQLLGQEGRGWEAPGLLSSK